MSVIRCPICNKGCELNYIPDGGVFKTLECQYTCSLMIDEGLLPKSSDDQKKLNMVFSDLITHRRTEPIGRHYYFDENSSEGQTMINDRVGINVATLMNHYPEEMMELFDRVLLNMYHLESGWPVQRFSSGMTYAPTQMRMCFGIPNKRRVEDNLVLSSMETFGYIVTDDGVIHFTKMGWDRVKELRGKCEASNTAFIAMSFKNTKEIREGIKAGIKEAGFEPVVVDEVEHNNQIVPEIFSQIERCRFLVMDLSVPNYGAYYEAGIARGMGKTTILTCSRESFEDKEHQGKRPHFDVAQQSMIVWDDINDLKNKLVSRIRMTI